VPTKPENRDYKKEAARESEERKQHRRDRQKARYDYEKKNGPLPEDVHIDHIKPLSRGGTNAPGNLRTRKDVKNESFRRDGPGGKPKKG
jgi:5-methylcytosine-specific restriction endonuclease McrA